MPKTKQQPPAYMANAEAFYGDAFDHKTKKAIARSMTEWAEHRRDPYREGRDPGRHRSPAPDLRARPGGDRPELSGPHPHRLSGE